MGKLTERAIQNVFNYDLKAILDVDLKKMIKGLRDFIASSWADKIILKIVLDPIRKLSHTLTYLEHEYFTYDPERFPNPIDQYVYIRESKEKIVAMVKELEPKDPIRAVVDFTLYKRVVWRIEHVCDYLIVRGNSHGFNYDILVEKMGNELEA